MSDNTNKYVTYYRVSTARQGASGLGLEGQRAAVERFCKGGAIVQEFQEVETGTNKRERPQLNRAIAECRRQGATLVIAKLDRLARNVHFVSGLMEAGIDFVACDIPTANRLTVHILAAVAEEEARLISERTKAALTAYKARGGKLGSHRPEVGTLTAEARKAGSKANSEAAKRVNDTFRYQAEAMRREGSTLADIAGRFNDSGRFTRRGKPWSPTAVHRLLK